MKTLSYLMVVTCMATSMVFCGCSKAGASVNGTKHYSGEDIQKALTIAQKIKALKMGGDQEWVINTQIGVLKQPFFPGAVGEEGAIVTFDEKDNPIRGITVRTFIRETGKPCEIHELLTAEIVEAHAELRDYYRNTLSVEDRKSIKTIVVFSEGFKDAVCESILNLRQDCDYYMSANKTDKTAGIYRVQSGIKSLIAENKVYYSRD